LAFSTQLQGVNGSYELLNTRFCGNVNGAFKNNVAQFSGFLTTTIGMFSELLTVLCFNKPLYFALNCLFYFGIAVHQIKYAFDLFGS